jgi:hypothetical protein
VPGQTTTRADIGAQLKGEPMDHDHETRLRKLEDRVAALEKEKQGIIQFLALQGRLKNELDLGILQLLLNQEVGLLKLFELGKTQFTMLGQDLGGADTEIAGLLYVSKTKFEFVQAMIEEMKEKLNDKPPS